jgi:hypothetical protein
MGADTPLYIPESARPFFQEYDFAVLDLDQHADLILERILAYGNRAEVRWLIQVYGQPRIQGWLAELGLRRLPWRRYHMGCLVFGLPEPEKPHRIWPN